MTATATLQRPQEKTGTWSTIFPNEQVTETQSALFVKKLLAVAVSNIAYLRAIFPEHSFGDRCLEDLNLKILRDDSSCPGACQVIKWVKGCFDALDKKYLKTLIIGIYVDPDNPDTVIESYTFRFSYTDQGGIDIYRNNKKISSAHTAAETKKATVRLLRTIVILTQTLRSLPDDVMMTMKLLYYDDVTPADYEPPGFKAAETDNFVFEEEPMSIKVGDVSTPFHSIKMRIKTDKQQFEMKEDVEEGEQEREEVGDTQCKMEENKEIEDMGLDEDVNMEEVKEADPNVYDFKDDKSNKKTLSLRQHGKNQKDPPAEVTVPAESPAKPESAVGTTGSQASQASETAEEYKVRCPCGCNEDDGLMIMCSVCKFWQHGVCFLVLDEEEAPEDHVCDVCAQPNDPGKKATDSMLMTLSPIAVQATCLWRRALMACTEMNRVVAPALAKRLGIEITVAQGLMNRLDKEGFIKSQGKGKRLGKVVDKTKVKNQGIPKYMKKQTDEKLEDSQVDDIELDPAQENRKIDQELEKLTVKTGGMKINNKLSSKKGKKSKTSEPKDSPKPVLEDLVEEDINNVEMSNKGEADTAKRRNRKRAISKVDGVSEFDICDSQDLLEECHPRKRKKASIVSKAIMV